MAKRLAASYTWTGDAVFAIAEASYLIGVASRIGTRGFDRSPKTTETFLRTLEDACRLRPSRGARLRTLRLADGLRRRLYPTGPAVAGEGEIAGQKGLSGRRPLLRRDRG